MQPQDLSQLAEEIRSQNLSHLYAAIIALATAVTTLFGALITLYKTSQTREDKIHNDYSERIKLNSENFDKERIRYGEERDSLRADLKATQDKFTKALFQLATEET